MSLAAADVPSSGVGPTRLALLLLPLLAFWTARISGSPDRGCLLDLVNLVFHEAGHLFLAPFGATLHYLGGTFGQIAVPALLAWYFLRTDPPQPVGTAACIWWIGENLVNVSVYMADARELALPLVGGGDHDWNELFYRFGLLGQESVGAVSVGTRAAGIVLMLVGLVGIAALAAPGWLRDRLAATALGRGSS